MPCQQIRDTSGVTFSTLCTMIAAKHRWLPNGFCEKKNAINPRWENTVLTNCLFDLTTKDLSINFQNYAKGNLDDSPCNTTSELRLN